ncbi:MAG TPA: tetratricopeptide repeat protein [Candidatus Binatia bacterium]|nr:tetratricopeptide repeat protein [Candidatus Binatia bacterium]
MPSLTMKSLACSFKAVALLVLWLVCATWHSFGAESNAPPAELKSQETNSQETLRSYVHLQEQIHAAQLAIEQNRQEARVAAEQTANALVDRLKTLEEGLATQRSRELDVMQNVNSAMQNSNRNMFVVGAAFAGIGFLAVLSMAYFQWRAVSRLAEISAALPATRALAAGPTLAALGPGDPPLVTVGPAEQSNLRLLEALERLEKRIFELEHTTGPAPAHDEQSGQGSSPGSAPSNGNGKDAAGSPDESAESGRITMLLGKGQSMLNLDQAEAALACFDEVLTLDPGHTEALVKKGAALEQMQKLNEAIECYDRAIAADASLTVAYLHKGGLFNRMERFNEALECYEKALRTQEKRG